MSVKHLGLAQSHTKRIRGGKALRRTVAMLLLVATVVPLSGCSAWTGVRNNWNYNGFWNESMMGYRNASSASRAWHARKHHFCNEKCMKDFARGFKAGYMGVADGGDGCTPAFPPREYWGWRYQSCEGQACVAAWYAGYPHGARAAEEDGIGNWTQIQTSAAIQNQYYQHGKLPEAHNGIYPVPQQTIPPGFQMNTGAVPMNQEIHMEMNTQIIPMPDPATY